MHYGSTFANVSLSWNEPAGRVDSYSIEVSSTGLMLSYSVTESELTLDELPYNEDITTTISAVNCAAESEKGNISFVISKHFQHAPIANNLKMLALLQLYIYNNIITGGCNSTLSPPLNGILYNSSNGIAAKGEQLWFGCEPGFYPRNPLVATCQEEGLWHPDPSEVDCRSKSNLTHMTL